MPGHPLTRIVRSKDIGAFFFKDSCNEPYQFIYDYEEFVDLQIEGWLNLTLFHITPVCGIIQQGENFILFYIIRLR
jgi:hypothetical protein